MAAERGEVLIWSRGGRKGAANEVVRAHSEEALFPETPRRAQKRFSKKWHVMDTQRVIKETVRRRMEEEGEGRGQILRLIRV